MDIGDIAVLADVCSPRFASAILSSQDFAWLKRPIETGGAETSDVPELVSFTMEAQRPYRPRVSREMRLLLIAGVLAIATLWLLARVRFRDLPVTPNPIPAVLTQLGTGASYDDLAEQIAQLHIRLDGSLAALAAHPRIFGPGATVQYVPALRLRDGLAVAWVPRELAVDEATVLARDPASGLTVVRVSNDAALPLPPAWTPRRLERPRYFIATKAAGTGVSLRPAFSGALDPGASASWSGPVWFPSGGDFEPGSFLFTSDAELVGLVIERSSEPAIVPAATLLAEVDRLLARPQVAAGRVGIDVQALTARLASVTGSSAGVVVVWVEPQSAAAGRVMVADVIEALDDEPLVSLEQWDVRVARLSAGQTLRLRIRRSGAVRDALVQATSVRTPAGMPALGLLMRRQVGDGSEVMRVEPDSAAERAGLVPGDVITLVADVRAPSPAHIGRVFGSLQPGQGALLGVSRGDSHFVTTLER